MRRFLTWLRCFWHGHEVELVDPLSMIARVHCVQCGRDFVIHRHEPGMIPWDEHAKRFFETHKEIMEKWLGGNLDYTDSWKGRV